MQNGQLPELHGHDAFLITGSPAGVYEPRPWIKPLMDFIRSADGAKMVGVCFGHQVMAEALGGHVQKSAKGWSAGLHRYRITHPSRGSTAMGRLQSPPPIRTRSCFNHPTPR